MSFLGEIRSRVKGHPITRDRWIDDLVQEAGIGEELRAVLRQGTWIDAALGLGRPVGPQDLRDRDPAEARAGALLLYLTLLQRVGARADFVFMWNRPERDSLVAFARRKLRWQPWEVVLLWWQLARYANDERWQYELLDVVKLPLAAAEELAPADRAPLLPTVKALHDAAAADDGFWADAAERLRASRRLAALLPVPSSRLPETVLADGDAFGPHARETLAREFDGSVLVPLVTHLASYAGGVTPTKKWRTQLDALLAADPAGAAPAVRLLELVTAHQETDVAKRHGRHTHVQNVFVTPETGLLLRAAVWAAAAAAHDGRRPGVLGVLSAAAEHCAVAVADAVAGELRCPQVASSVVAVLGEADDDLAVAQLTRLRARIRNRTLLKAIDKALLTVAARAGTTPGQLVERSVPTFDLDPSGTTLVELGKHSAVVTVSESGVRLTWRSTAGRDLRSVPKPVREEYGEQLAAVRTRVKQAGKALATQRARVEELMAGERTWPVPDWSRFYVGHPLTGAVARALVWQAASPADPDAWLSGLPVETDGGWALEAADGTRQPVPADATLRLWHPIRETADVVAAWRQALTERRLRQPFKQAFREIYLLTPAEEATDTYSNRFAAHILRYRQAGALIRARGWAGNHLGYWDGGYNGEAVRELGDSGWRARFYYDLVENAHDEYGTPSLCSTDQVRFERAVDTGAGAPRWDQVRLGEVPALAFSEAMRDVDLFVGVASIAADPEWRDRGETRYLDYWARTTFGELAPSAQVRRDALQRLMPRTRIADRVRVTERFLEVDGSWHTYKIHLGSGNILMSPNDAYLCIVPARDMGGAGRAEQKLFLPFEEDGGLLSLIVSKAFLLADDAAITDRTILSQLRRG